MEAGVNFPSRSVSRTAATGGTLSKATSNSWNMPHDVMTAGKTSGSKFPAVPLMKDATSANVRNPIIGKYLRAHVSINRGGSRPQARGPARTGRARCAGLDEDQGGRPPRPRYMYNLTFPTTLRRPQDRIDQSTPSLARQLRLAVASRFHTLQSRRSYMKSPLTSVKSS